MHLNYVICPADPADAAEEYISVLWAASFETQHFHEYNREVYHLVKDLPTETDGTTWWDCKHYVEKAHDMRRAATTDAKLELYFGKMNPLFRSRNP